MGFNFLSENIEVFRNPPDTLEANHNKLLLRGVQVATAGYFPEAFKHNLKRDPIDDFVVIYCTAGKGYYKFENNTWEVNPGDMLHCWKGIPHRYWADKETPWTIFWFHLQGKEVESLLKEAGLEIRHPVLSLGISPQIISLFREILDVMKEGNHYQSALYISSLARQILSTQIYLKHQSHKPLEEDGQFKEILKYLSEHIKESIDIPTMAKHCHLSSSYFIRKFKTKFGYSPVEYFNRLKVQSACHLLLVSDRSIKEICFSLGYEDPLYFSRLFSKVMGKSPREYRRTNQI
jgi:AraC-like DNA-binding protein